MPFITLQGEKQLSELIEAHYGALKPADAGRAEKLLLEANPELKNLKDLRPGTVVRIPGLVGRKPARTANETSAPVSQVLLAQLEALAGTLRSDIADETGALKEDRRKLDSAPVRRVLEQLPELRPAAEAVRQGMKRREQALEQAQVFEKLLPAIK